MRKMRRMLALFLAAAMLLSMTACGRKPNDEGSLEYTAYYMVRNPESLESRQIIRQETISGYYEDPVAFLNRYFAGPDSDELVSPFPEGTKLTSLLQEDSGVTLVLSGEFFTLSGAALSAAECCLCRTVCDYFGVSEIFVADERRQASLTLRPDQFLLEDQIQEGSKAYTFTLYFTDSTRSVLQTEVRQATLSENESQELYVARQLVTGPEESAHKSIIPEGTELLSAETADGICYLDFSSEFVDNAFTSEYGPFTTICGIVDTMTSLDGVDAVCIRVEGKLLVDYSDLRLNAAMEYYGGTISDLGISASDIVVGVMVDSLEDGSMHIVPMLLTESASRPVAETLMTALLNFTPPTGYGSPIPYGTKLLSLTTSGGTCYVDFSKEFIPEGGREQDEENAVRAVVSALTQLSGIDEVMLTIEGEPQGLNYVDLTHPLQ